MSGDVTFEEAGADLFNGNRSNFFSLVTNGRYGSPPTLSLVCPCSDMSPIFSSCLKTDASIEGLREVEPWHQASSQEP